MFNALRVFFVSYLLKPVCYIALILITLFILNQFTYFNISLGTNNNFNTFEVIGTGKISTVPQDARISFTVEKKRTTQEAAKDAANKIQNQAVSKLLALGIPRENIKTTNISVNPNYEIKEGSPQPLVYPPGRQVQNGYVAILSTQIKGSINQINKSVDLLSSLGANVGGVEYISKNKEELKEQAQAKAIADAKKQAQNIAQAAGFRLGKIVTVRSADDQYPQPYGADVTIKSAPNMDTQIQPGETEITARMGVTYYIKN